MKKKKSDFGRGLVYNLVLFANHFQQARKIFNIDFVYNHKDKDKILVDNPKDKYNYGFNKEVKFWFDNLPPYRRSYKKALSWEIKIWANGASDHLYEIEVPEKWRKRKIGKLVKRLKDKGLKMGHGLTGTIWTVKDIKELMKLTKKIALLIDKELGVNPIRAKWE